MAIERISSIKDERIAEARALASATGRSLHRKILLYGMQSLRWAVSAGLRLNHVFCPLSYDDIMGLKRLTLGVPCYGVTDGVLKKITGVSHVISEVGVADYPSWPWNDGHGAVVLDGVKDHGNIGTLVRTAVAFGFMNILSTDVNSDIYYRNIVAASRGMAFMTAFQRCRSGTEAVRYLKDKGYCVIVTSSHATVPLHDVALPSDRVAVVFGNETDGVGGSITRQSDVVVRVPTSSVVESLNVGVAGGIVLYEISKFLRERSDSSSHVVPFSEISEKYSQE